MIDDLKAEAARLRARAAAHRAMAKAHYRHGSKKLGDLHYQQARQCAEAAERIGA